MMTEVQPRVQETKADAMLWYIIRCNDEVDALKPTLPEALQVTDGTDQEGLLTKSRVVP